MLIQKLIKLLVIQQQTQYITNLPTDTIPINDDTDPEPPKFHNDYTGEQHFNT